MARRYRNNGVVLPTFAHANANFVTDRLAVGGDLSPNFGVAHQQIDELVDAGISHIVDLRSEWSDENLVHRWAPQLAYLHHRVDDAGQQIEADWFAGLVEWVTAALADPEAKVLLHCHMGVNRAPSAMLAVLLAQGMSLRPALDAIRQARPVAVIDYADSVLSWHFAQTDADARLRRNARRVLSRWRQRNHLDPTAVIRAIRDTETSGNRWLVRLGPDDPAALARFAAESADSALGLSVDADPAELSLFDEVLFLTGAGLVGRALVVGPVEPAEPYALLLPVLLTDIFEPRALDLPPPVRQWLDGAGPNPLLVSAAELRALAGR